MLHCYSVDFHLGLFSCYICRHGIKLLRAGYEYGSTIPTTRPATHEPGTTAVTAIGRQVHLTFKPAKRMFSFTARMEINHHSEVDNIFRAIYAMNIKQLLDEVFMIHVYRIFKVEEGVMIRSR